MVKTGKNGENIKGNPPNPAAPQPPAPRCCPVGKPRPKNADKQPGQTGEGGEGLGRTQQQQQPQQPPPPPPLPESSSSTCSSRSSSRNTRRRCCSWLRTHPGGERNGRAGESGWGVWEQEESRARETERGGGVEGTHGITRAGRRRNRRHRPRLPRPRSSPRLRAAATPSRRQRRRASAPTPASLSAPPSPARLLRCSGFPPPPRCAPAVSPPPAVSSRRAAARRTPLRSAGCRSGSAFGSSRLRLRPAGRLRLSGFRLGSSRLLRLAARASQSAALNQLPTRLW